MSKERGPNNNDEQGLRVFVFFLRVHGREALSGTARAHDEQGPGCPCVCVFFVFAVARPSRETSTHTTSSD